jgi:outer membrane receptor for ferrienterochelin and colicin
MSSLKYRWAAGSLLGRSASALYMAAWPLGAAAQDALEEIVIQGYRSSLNASLNAKRESNGAVDVIIAEDIADFPDLNLAEALQRIPGVAITRAAGEGRQVTVRGLGPTFTTTRINGMEALATISTSRRAFRCRIASPTWCGTMVRTRPARCGPSPTWPPRPGPWSRPIGIATRSRSVLQ